MAGGEDEAGVWEGAAVVHAGKGAEPALRSPSPAHEEVFVQSKPLWPGDGAEEMDAIMGALNGSPPPAARMDGALRMKLLATGQKEILTRKHQRKQKQMGQY